MASAAARAACAAQPGFSEDVQLNATGKLAISCKPAENDGRSAPCIHEAFFSFPAGFEEMGVPELTRRAHWRRIDPFNQCRSRTRDEEWPTAELVERRTPTTKTMADVMALLGRRVVTLVGTSVMLF